MSNFRPPPLLAATASSIQQAALTYSTLGFSVLPLSGKCPTVPWHHWQTHAAPEALIRQWFALGLLQNVGLVCGTASANLVVLDLDDPRGYTAFATTFSSLRSTYTVATGSGHGKHLYFYATRLPMTTRALNTRLGNLELRAQGCQIVAPPSLHPLTHFPYRVEQPLPIQVVPDLTDLTDWIRTYLPKSYSIPTRLLPLHSSSTLNPHVLDAVAERLSNLGFTRHGEWLNGPCLCPTRHRHHDRHPSFGFNLRTGYGFCFVCGTFLTKDLCALLDIDPRPLGGLLRSYFSLDMQF